MRTSGGEDEPLAAPAQAALGEKLVGERGRLMQMLPEGAMLAVPLSESEVQRWLNNDISLAAVNAPSSCVLSGTTDAITKLEQELKKHHVDFELL